MFLTIIYVALMSLVCAFLLYLAGEQAAEGVQR